MRLNFFNLVFLILFLSCSLARLINHTCQHDKLADSIVQEVVQQVPNEHSRNTHAVSPRNMKITYDLSYFNFLPDTPKMKEFKTYSQQALQIAIQYFSDLIMIYPKIGHMRWTSSSSKCGIVIVPSVDKLIDKDSDLHLYVSFTSDEAQYLAYAGSCRAIFGIGSTHGILNFNLVTFQTYDFSDSQHFQEFVEILIHEITHTLGFSKSDIQNWADSKREPYENPFYFTVIRGNKTPVLTTPNVLEVGRKYFGCPELVGVPLENQGDFLSIGSHWEMTVLNGEIMISELSSSKLFFSAFTTALLRDTGYYYSVTDSLEEQMFYGKGKGCSFIHNECQQDQREYCKQGDPDDCDYSQLSVSTCHHSKFADEGCSFQYPYTNGHCFQAKGNILNKEVYSEKLGIKLSEKSRCIKSSLSDPSVTIQIQGLCYSVQCIENNSIAAVSVGQHQLLCKENNQILTIDGWKGNLFCPNNIAEFCQMSLFCENNCSKHGYCIKSICHCLKGFSGNDCSIEEK